MSGILNQAFPNKYIINREEAGPDKTWSTHLSYDKFLMLKGQHVKDYVDITYIADQLDWNNYGVTQSEEMAPIYDYVMGSGGINYINKNFIRYRVYGEPDHRAMSVGNINDHENLGLGGFDFKIALDVDWYEEGQRLAPIYNKRIQIVLTSGPSETQGGYEYSAVMLEEDGDAILPEEYLSYGMYWISMGSVASWEKYSGKGGVQVTDNFSYLEFEVPLSTSEWKFTVDGETHRQWGNMSITRCDNEGRPMPDTERITNYLDVKARRHVKREIDLINAWGTSATHLIDSNTSKQITTSAGYFDFMEQGNVIPYMPGPDAIDFIVDQLETVWFDRVPEAQRTALFLTGTPGLRQFSEWVEARFGSTATIQYYDFVLKKRVPFDNAHDRDGYALVRPQFTEYHLPSFGRIIVGHWKALDNTRDNGAKFPGTIYPARAYEYICFDIGFGQSNLQFFERDDNVLDLIEPGYWSPAGAVGPDNPIWKQPSYHDESYKWIHRRSFGAVLMRPEASVWFKPSITA